MNETLKHQQSALPFPKHHTPILTPSPLKKANSPLNKPKSNPRIPLRSRRIAHRPHLTPIRIKRITTLKLSRLDILIVRLYIAAGFMSQHQPNGGDPEEEEEDFDDETDDGAGCAAVEGVVVQVVGYYCCEGEYEG